MGLFDSLVEVFVPEIKVGKKALEDAAKKAKTDTQRAAIQQGIIGFQVLKKDTAESAKKFTKKALSVVTTPLGLGELSANLIDSLDPPGISPKTQILPGEQGGIPTPVMEGGFDEKVIVAGVALYLILK